MEQTWFLKWMKEWQKGWLVSPGYPARLFSILLIYGVYVAKAIRDANRDSPPWMAVAIFDLIVMALLRQALNDRFKPQ